MVLEMNQGHLVRKCECIRLLEDQRGETVHYVIYSTCKFICVGLVLSRCGFCGYCGSIVNYKLRKSSFLAPTQAYL
jgi:hypothetical protein